MEWALFIRKVSDLDELEYALFPWSDSADSREPEPLSSENDRMEIPPFVRAYFGNEFCEALIPDIRVLQNALFRTRERGLSFTFVTPQVTDDYLEVLKGCFSALVTSGKNVEVVVNDWGVMRVLRTHYPELVPVMGRIMNRGWRLFEQSNARNLNYFPFRRFLLNYGMRRVEFDCPLQFEGIDFENTGLTGSVYYPYSCCVTGTSCTTSVTGEPVHDSSAGAPACSRICTDDPAEPARSSGRQDGGDQVWAASRKASHEARIASCGDIAQLATSTTIDRIIYQLQPER